MSPSVLLLNDGNVVDKETSPSNGVDAAKSSTSAVLHRTLHHDPHHVVGAQGHYLRLSNGQEIFDATGGAAVACIGHGDVRVQDALIEQMHEVSYCHSLFYATRAAEDLAKFLVDSTDGEMSRAFFVSSGSEAMEAALKMARQYHLEKAQPEPQRAHFISRHQSYHGTTLGALAAGGHVARRAIFEPMLATNSSRVSPCYAYRGLDSANDTEAAYTKRLEAELEAAFQRVGPKKVAAFIAEPVVGAALGCVPPVAGYFKAVRRICDKYGALLIFDEVMCGTGRIGPEPSTRFPKPLHAWQDPLIGVVPDLQTLGKGLGGGYMPVAAMLASAHVVEVLEHGTGAFSHGQTYQGHPLACKAALEVQKIIQEDNLIANVRKQGALLGRLLKERLGSHSTVGNIRGSGLFWAIEFVKCRASKTPFEPALGVAMGLHELGMQRPYNVSLYPGTGSADGRRGDHIILAPAYNITSDEIRHLVETVTLVVTQFFTAHGAELRDAAAAMPTAKIVESGSEPVLIQSSVMHRPARR
ncbi:Putative aminotransferase class-III, pyridoxal phosphate-dependent transferase, major [Septoria linicola]|uniref:Aminotransferase class-III, pyridoxal phosphate-dependent transferase, major n=1 Tax=Septoria linicola TaxID=215465 RepID=A0A9Q9EH16_9PEZI|nr:Putative aminotransferase class-III, pyridoxal phosphate-dependent transferase, major [Septoria linicola]